MTDPSGASAAAHPPTVVAADDVAALQAALALAIESNAREQAETEGQRNIDSLEASIAKQQALLDDTKERLKDAKAAEKDRVAKAKEDAKAAAEQDERERDDDDDDEPADDGGTV